MTVSQQMSRVATHDATNIQTLMPALYGKPRSQRSIANQAIGIAIGNENSTSRVKSRDKSNTTLDADPPRTFLTPISFTRCSVVNVARPNNPRQAIRIVSAEKVV